MVEWQTRDLEVVVPFLGVGVQVPPSALCADVQAFDRDRTLPIEHESYSFKKSLFMASWWNGYHAALRKLKCEFDSRRGH